ncbi:MAG: prolyl oligopeptidase family serine peptidase [Gemmatimonadota bacterium]|nr:prolyl oligopeptidase family serine peptidase [Gemmatimonadota bacterium]MDH5760407.1 prolyl oligopeptidase family serine peptidase [Gemmatimonadota bacterium]
MERFRPVVSSCVRLALPMILFGHPVAAQDRMSVEDVLAYSFPASLVSAGDQDRVAWVENIQGIRNVWIAEGPGWAGRPLTTYDADDGQDITNLTLLPGGSGVMYVRGGAPNRQGEVPDPLSTPAEEGRALWIVPLDGGAPGKILDEGGYALRPDGGSLAYSKGREIWLKHLDEEGPGERLARVRGGAGRLSWSPDGTRLAFVSSRGDHAFVGILDIGATEIRYMAPSVHQDGEPVWSPDGRRIAFIRQRHERDIFPFMPRREGLPFSVLVADVETGAASEVWTASPGPGSLFSGVDADRQLFWTRDDLLVFPWEGDGWKHLYAVSAGGGSARVLTPGAFEVQYVSLAPDGRTVLYDSNQDDIDRKHVWSVDSRGGAPHLLTPGEGLEWAPVGVPGGSVAYLSSGTRVPAHPVVRGPDGRTSMPRPPLPDGYPRDRLVEPSQVVFPAADGMEIHGQLFLPAGYREGRTYPAVLFFHGGSRRQMLLGFHHRGYYHNAYAFNQLLASRGYIVLAVNYRSGVGYGLDFREAEAYGATGASEYQDVVGAALYLRGRGDVDPRRVGLWGGSYGGYLTALGLARASDLFAAGVDLHGVHDWNVVIRGFRPDYDPKAHPEFSRLAFESSPMNFLDGWRSPVLIIHGDDDRNVPFSESVDLAESLAARGVEFEQLIFPDEVHGFLLHRNWVAAYEAALDFLDRRLNREEDR